MERIERLYSSIIPVESLTPNPPVLVPDGGPSRSCFGPECGALVASVLLRDAPACPPCQRTVRRRHIHQVPCFWACQPLIAARNKFLLLMNHPAFTVVCQTPGAEAGRFRTTVSFARKLQRTSLSLVRLAYEQVRSVSTLRRQGQDNVHGEGLEWASKRRTQPC